MAAKKKRASGSVRRGPGSKSAPARKAASARSGGRKATGRKSTVRKPTVRKAGTGQGSARKSFGRKPRTSDHPQAADAASRAQESTDESSGLWGKVLEQSRVEEAASDQGLVRLNAWLARCGVASRRKSDELIAAGRIQVEGKVVRSMGHKIDPLRDVVKVDGEVLRPERPTYVLLNKPKSVVCTNSPNEQKLRAIDLLTGVKGRLFTVGRLDADSEGLLILTNDGAFADRMTHPRYEVAKTYQVVVRGRIEKAKLDKVKGGVWLSEGRVEGFQIRVKKRGKERTILEVTIREGRNREIRRVFARVGHPVLRLTRIRMGNLTLRGVSSGKWRFLKPQEITGLLAPTERHAN